MQMRRSRGRGNGHGGNGGGGQHSNSSQSGNRRSGGGVPNRHQVFDSNGPEVRIRGNAWQVYEKYQALARDAQAAGDRVKAENCLQHAEHYYRIILAINEAMGESMPRPRPEEGEAQQPGVTVLQQTSDPAQMPQPATMDIDLTPPEAAVA